MRKIVSLLFMMILLVSCEDFFRTYMTVDPPPYKQSIVVNMYIDDSDTTIRASVSRNIGALETVKKKRDLLLFDAIVLIKDSQGEIVCMLDTVTIVNEEDTVGFMPMPGNMVNYMATLPGSFQGYGKKFVLEVTHPDFGKATAIQTMPEKPDISQPTYKYNAGMDMDGNSYDQVSFTLHDPADEENYYQMKLWYDDEENFSRYMNLNTNDPLYVYSYDYNALLLQDKTFNGEDFPVKLRFNGDFGYYDENGEYVPQVGDTIPGKMYVEIKTITKDFYLYSRSLVKAQDMQDIGFFMEPVSVYNNIKNGLGIFSLSAGRMVLVGKE